MDLKTLIRDVPDYPKTGIVFKDLTTLWKDPEALKQTVDLLAEHYQGKKIKKIVGAESRGFIVGAPLAYAIGAGFIPARKPNKLPAAVVSKNYQLEYGQSSMQIHVDAISKGDKVLLVDDLLATGGTTKAIIELVETLGGEVLECAYLIELEFLNGRKMLNKPVFSLIKYA
jgi:adenine phosphoribosyltransferase